MRPTLDTAAVEELLVKLFVTEAIAAMSFATVAGPAHQETKSEEVVVNIIIKSGLTAFQSASSLRL